MKNLYSLILVVLLFLVGGIAGCGSDSTDFGGTGSTGSLRITNNSAYSVNYVYLSPASTTTWGSDLLGVANIILPGGNYTIYNIPPGVYDSKITLSSNNSWIKYNLTIATNQIYAIEVPSNASKVTVTMAETSKADVLMNGGVKGADASE